jgi:hypothetical protein
VVEEKISMREEFKITFVFLGIIIAIETEGGG